MDAVVSMDTMVSKVSDDPGSCEYWSKVPEPRDDLDVHEPFDTLVRTDADVADEYMEDEDGLTLADFSLDTRSGDSRNEGDDASVMVSMSKMEFIEGDFVYGVGGSGWVFLDLAAACAFKFGCDLAFESLVLPLPPTLPALPGLLRVLVCVGRATALEERFSNVFPTALAAALALSCLWRLARFLLEDEFVANTAAVCAIPVNSSVFDGDLASRFVVGDCDTFDGSLFTDGFLTSWWL